MGTVWLGALLGRNQSFEDFDAAAGVPEGWARVTAQASFAAVGSATAVHSSALGLMAVVDSTGGAAGVLRYDHGAADDAPRVWHPEVTTHHVISTVWARAVAAVSSGALCWQLAVGSATASAPIAQSAAMVPVTVQGWAGPATMPAAALARTAGAMAPATVLLDDVLTVTDRVALEPDWTLEQRHTVQRTRHRPAGGALRERHWHEHPAVRLPLRGITGGAADRIAWWWETQRDLALTLDDADPESVRVCRLVNARHPVGRRRAPYGGRYDGVLELAGTGDGRLSF